MSYPSPPPADQPPPRGGSRQTPVDAGSFVNDLFDLRFTRFVSLRLISLVYVMILLAVTIVALIAIFWGFVAGVPTGLLAIVLAGLGWMICVVLARVALEAYAVLFRIHDDTSRMAAATAGGPGADPSGGHATAATYPGYAQSGYPQSGYPQSGYPQSGYGQAGSGGHVPPGHVAPGTTSGEVAPPPWQ
jgi:hypothetical protein